MVNPFVPDPFFRPEPPGAPEYYDYEEDDDEDYQLIQPMHLISL